MNNTPLERFYSGLVPVLWEELFFFIPNDGILNEFFDKNEKFDFKKYRNKILVLDYFQGPILYLPDRDNTRAITKGQSLKKNIYQLLDKKNGSSEIEIAFILEQYYEQVECLFYVTRWMNDNLAQIPNVDGSVISLFQLQHNDFKTHFKTLLKHFYPNMVDVPEGNLNLVGTMETYFPRLYQHYNRKEIGTEQAQNPIQEEVNDNHPPSFHEKETVNVKAKKSPIITEKEAETILLKRIFNIDPSPLK